MKDKKSIIRNKKGAAAITANVILVATILTLGFLVTYWASSTAQGLNNDYVNTTNENLEGIKEALSFEYISYDETEKELIVYLMNHGSSDNVSIARLYIISESSMPMYKNIEFKAFNGTTIQGVDPSEEGYFIIDELTLEVNTVYNLRIITQRNSNFYSRFAT